MNKQLLSMAAIYIGLSFSSCTKINGEGPVVTESRSISNFHGIRNAISGDVYLKQDSIYKVEIRAQRNIIDILNTNINDGELKIDYDYNKRIGSHDKVEIFISCPDIRSLAVSGSGNITMMNKCTPASMDMNVSGSGSISLPDIDTRSISARISGSGNIVVFRGMSDLTTTEISGSGYMDMVGVNSLRVDSRISGSGDTKVMVKDELNVRISGSGDLYYRGNPKVTSSVSGSGKVRMM